MKLLQILLLLGAGALVGTLVTRVWLRPNRPALKAAIAPAATHLLDKQPAPTASLSTATEPPRPASLISASPQPHTARRAAKTVARKIPASRQIQPASTPLLTILAKFQAPPSVSTPPPTSIPTPPAKPPKQDTIPPETNQPSPHQVTLRTGLSIPVRLAQRLSTETSKPGDTFTATIDQEIVVDGFVIVERGAPVVGRVTAVDRGTARLIVELTRLYTADRQRVAIQTESFEVRPEVPQPTGESDMRGLRSAPAILPADTRIRFRLRISILLTEKLG